MSRIAALLAVLVLAPALAHEVIDAETAERHLARIAALGRVANGAGVAESRAEALYELGDLVGGMVERLNRDLAFHRGETGLVSGVLVAELEARGVDLAFSEAADRYLSYLAPFEGYLSLAPEGPRRADALFRVLAGGFYDSFVTDPFQLVGLDWPGLLAQIASAEAFLARSPQHRDREEARFILAVDYARAAREAPDDAAAGAYAAKARAALQAFAEAYPESMRAAAAQVLIEALPAAD